MTAHPLVLQRATAVPDNGILEFSTAGGLARALRDGCFLLAIPDTFDAEPCLTLCHEFHRDPADLGGHPDLDAYRGFKTLDGVYFDREHFQTEHLLVDGPGRERWFPRPVRETADHMQEFTQLVLCAALTALGIAPDLWHPVTGGACDGEGTHWFAANHYRSERPQLGCAPHKDTGFVTVLHQQEPGLEILRDGAWVPVDPVPGHFVVNFGGAFELLTTALPTPVHAPLHRVRQCTRAPGTPNRVSFAAFANPPATGDLFQVRPDGAAVPVRNAADFLREFNEQTWADRHDDFGIVRPSAGAA